MEKRRQRYHCTILAEKYKVQKTQGNYNNHIGLPLTILELDTDTEVAVLEMGMSDYGEIDFNKDGQTGCGSHNNIGDAHLQQFGSRDGIAKQNWKY